MSAGQSKRHSVIEALLNVGSGMVIAFTISQLGHFYQDEIRKYIWPSFTWNLSLESNAVMTGLLTVASMIRGYVWRRIFNKIQLRRIKKDEDTRTV